MNEGFSDKVSARAFISLLPIDSSFAQLGMEANIRQGITHADQLLQTALKEALEPK